MAGFGGAAAVMLALLGGGLVLGFVRRRKASATVA
jgi:hypothetical protein